MKPGDHPDFYRFPPPPGRSRESRIVLDAQGRFWNEGVLMEHPGMVRTFASWVTRHPDDGRFILSNGYDWTYFTVEDTPCFVRAIDLRAGVPWVTLLDGSEEPLDPASVMTGTGEALYVRVRGGTLEAKLLPRAQSALVEVLTEDPEGHPAVRVPGGLYPLRPRPTRDPAAATPSR
jgi:uncharacterized protein